DAEADAEADAGAEPDVEVDVEAPEAPEPPEPPAVAAPRAPRPPRAPRAVVVCPDVKVHMAPVVVPNIAIPPVDVQINAEKMGKMSREIAAMARASAAIAMRELTPSKEYKEKMCAAGLSMSDADAKRLYLMGVSPRYVQSLRAAGLKNLTARDVERAHAP